MRWLAAPLVLLALMAVACVSDGAPEGGPRIAQQAVVGTDDRVRITDTTAFPWSSIAYLELYDRNGTPAGHCTGTFVGPDAVLTAAHCLYNDDFGGWIGSVRVVPGKDGSREPLGSMRSSTFWVPDEWVEDDQPTLRDWGLVALSNETLGRQTGWLTLAVLSDETLASDSFQPGIVGYHGDVRPLRSLWGHFVDEFNGVQSSNLLYEIDATGGSSGSAILSADSRSVQYGKIVGIHAYSIDLGETEGYNFGRRMTQAVIDDLLTGCRVLNCVISWESDSDPRSVTPHPTPMATLTPTETSTPSPSSPNWAQIDSLRRRVLDRSAHPNWDDTIRATAALWDEWVVLVRTESRPSNRLRSVARQQVTLNMAMRNWLASPSLRSDPAMRNFTARRWMDAAYDYWASLVERAEALEAYALARVEVSTVERAYLDGLVIEAQYARAKCNLFRMQRYQDAGIVCAEANAAESAAEATN